RCGPRNPANHARRAATDGGFRVAAPIASAYARSRRSTLREALGRPAPLRSRFLRRGRCHGSGVRPVAVEEEGGYGAMESHADVAARDDAHLRSLGIKPELRRTLGFLSNFAVAFSYISVSTGTFTNQAVAFGVGGPAIFWAWPLVILGQTFVALNFA